MIDHTADWLSAGEAAVSAVGHLVPDVDVIVDSQNHVEANRHCPGTIIREALREGTVAYTRAS